MVGVSSKLLLSFSFFSKGRNIFSTCFFLQRSKKFALSAVSDFNTSMPSQAYSGFASYPCVVDSVRSSDIFWNHMEQIWKHFGPSSSVTAIFIFDYFPVTTWYTMSSISPRACKRKKQSFVLLRKILLMNWHHPLDNPSASLKNGQPPKSVQLWSRYLKERDFLLILSTGLLCY